MRAVDGVQMDPVSHEFLWIGPDDPQRRPIRRQTPYGLRLLSMQIAAAVQ